MKQDANQRHYDNETHHENKQTVSKLKYEVRKWKRNQQTIVSDSKKYNFSMFRQDSDRNGSFLDFTTPSGKKVLIELPASESRDPFIIISAILCICTDRQRGRIR